MRLHIAAITTRIVEHPLHQSKRIRSHAGFHDVSRYLTVALRDSDGLVGYGEAATTPLWSGETAETSRSIIEEVFIPKLKRATFDHPREVLAVMDGLSYNNPFAKSAVETAAWDLWARAQDVRAVSLFGDREPTLSIPVRASVGCYDVQETVRIATEFWNAGIRVLKFKIGVPDFDDAARLRATRQALGDEPVFTVDANGAYRTIDAAAAAIDALLPFNVALVEQPTPRERVQLMADVRRRGAVPILADESVFTCDHLREVLDCDACDYVSLYPGKNGGITHTIAMAQLAQLAGKPCVIGSNLETDIGQAAMANIAAGLTAFPVENLASDLSASLFYEHSSVRDPLKMQAGELLVPRGVGFGVEPQEL